VESLDKRSKRLSVLFLTYKRLETSEKVFSAIRDAQPEKLYFANNAAIEGNVEEEAKVNSVRKLVDQVDWKCEVHTRFLESHMSVRDSIFSSISWFFENEEQGIILEDDCLPNPEFFKFCSEMLYRYKKEESVWAITGNNFQNGILRGDASYFFSSQPHIWGWATWKSIWVKVDQSMSFWPAWKRSEHWHTFWDNKIMKNYWYSIFEQMYRSEINTWDYVFDANVFYHSGLIVTPNKNLVSNIGFGPGSTYTFYKNHKFSNMPRENIYPLIHPKKIERNRTADYYDFYNTRNGKYQRWPFTWLRRIKQIFFKK